MPSKLSWKASRLAYETRIQIMGFPPCSYFASCGTSRQLRPWLHSDQALPFGDQIVAVGFDSAERGHPPAKFADVFARAQGGGLSNRRACRRGRATRIYREALDVLKVSRIDHGVRCEEDAMLVAELTARRMPLTVCPLSNVMLNVFPSLEEHNLKRLLARGVV